MLAVYIDQILAEITQDLGRGGAAVDIGAGTAIPVDDPAQHEFIFMIDALLVQDIADRPVNLFKIKDCGDFGTVALAADDRAVGSISQYQTQGIDNDRFTSSGFAGKDCHPRVKLNLEFFNNGKITDMQMFQQMC